MNDTPILNNPYEEPQQHYHTNPEGELDYTQIRTGRRIFVPEMGAMPNKQKSQQAMFEVNELAAQYGTHLINQVRREVAAWREAGYPNTTRVSLELLRFWFCNPERHALQKLFFAQREAIETAVWLNEVAAKANAGQDILRQLQQARMETEQLPRIAFKMATGTGKTVVMASLMVYHLCNRQEYRQDTRFADYFLVIAPGITIKDRLGVLLVDQKSSHKNQRGDYYAQRDLVPRHLEQHLSGLNARLVITNYHAFELRALQGSKRSPFDGKIQDYNEAGKPLKQVAKEDTRQMLKRVLSGFKQGKRLLILNDEAHHCYLPKQKGKTKDTEGDENAKAAIWFNGVFALSQYFKLAAVYDLSATPYYLQGSGYDPYSLFAWTVTDFGLIEAIESGLVKIPYLPEGDDSQALEMPVLRNLYEHVKEDLPKKGRRTRKKEAKAEGASLVETPPDDLPPLVKNALDQFYSHYKEYAQLLREKGEEQVHLFSRPPVFIAVCNNTSVSKELYKYIAGYEFSEAEEPYVIPGHYDLFSNYDEQGRLKRKAPTLLIDSEALEDAGQINNEFKQIFAAEIAEFKQDYARLHGQGAAAAISDADILREVVNTVGEPNKLGAHIRCVVSVSMLTEGWDANTVTHIMGLRAFGSQLLCEQVAGRALRRMNYHLQAYDKRTGKAIVQSDVYRYKADNLLYKFPPEYAHIIGVPFKLFKRGSAAPVDTPELRRVFAIPERQQDFEITFPNVEGYRIEYAKEELLYDFSDIENYEIDGSKYPTQTTMETAFSGHKEQLSVEQVLEKREQELIYLLTQALLQYHFRDDDGNRQFHQFNALKNIVQYWYDNKVYLLNIRDPAYKKMLYFYNKKSIVDHIARGINPHLNNAEFIRPVLNRYNPFSSTKYVGGNTSKEIYPAIKSHVNAVVMDSDWEGVCGKTLDELDEVDAYVKNQFLGFTVPYVKDGKDKLYYPDFIARVKKPDGSWVNLIIEISGFNKDKAEKVWTVEKRWLPAVNAVRAKHQYDAWQFIEIANDIRDIKNQLMAKIRAVAKTA